MRLDPIAVDAGLRLESLGTTGSTNAEARLRAQQGEVGPLWITAAAQTQGRGRHGRSWISPPGNLYASLLLRDPSPFEYAPQFAFVAALALRDAVALEAKALSPLLKFKWPNDLLLDGRKCAGLLIEGETTPAAEPGKRFIVIIGIGVNCRNHPAAADGSIDFPATDLAAHGVAIAPEQQVILVAHRQFVAPHARHNFAAGDRDDRLDHYPRLQSGARIAAAKQ